MVLLTVASIAHALFAVFYALGSRAVIDSAVAGERADFIRACAWQGGIICGILLFLILGRHLRD